MRHRDPMFLKTPNGLLRWDPSKSGPVPGMSYRATLDGRAVSDDSLLPLLVLYAPDGF